jgi:glycosyltransferase involved in cell wall biosynthesis
VIYSGLGGHAAVLFSLLDGGYMSCSKHHIVLAGTEPPLANYIERLEKLGIHWSYVGKSAGSGHFKFYISLYKEFVSQKPDLILLNGLSSIPAILLLKCRRIFKRPIVLLRETEPVQLKSKFEWTLLALAHILVDQVVHLSSEASQGSKDVLGILHRDKKIKIIPNGLDTNFYCPNIDKVKSDTIHIGMVSRLHPKKDHTTLIVAFKKLTIAKPDIQLHLHIAGEGETKLAIEQEINKNNLADNVTMHGLLDSTEIRDLLQQLDI